MLIVAKTMELFEPLVVGRDVERIFNSFAQYWRELVSEDQIRWVISHYGTLKQRY